MSPPNAPGVPGMRLPPAAQRADRRPPMSNPPPPESLPAPPAFRHPAHEDNPPLTRPRNRQPSQRDMLPDVEIADDRPSVVEFQREVRAGYGGATFSGPAWVLVLLLLVGALGMIIYLLATRSQPVAANCATTDQLRAIDAKVDALGAGFVNLTTKVTTDGERLHNDLELQKLKLDVLTQRQK